MNVTKHTVTRPIVTNPHELRDEDIKKYIDLFVKEEVENGGDAKCVLLKDSIEVYLRFNLITFLALSPPDTWSLGINTYASSKEKLNSEKLSLGWYHK